MNSTAAGSQSYDFQKPLISGQISCNFCYTEQPLILLILRALDKREGIPVKCCNAAAFWRRPSVAPFNLFRGRKIFFSLQGCSSLYAYDVCYFDKARHQAAGNRKWYQDVVRVWTFLAHWEVITLGGRHRGCIPVQISVASVSLTSAAADKARLTCSAGIYGFSSQKLISHSRVNRHRQELDTCCCICHLQYMNTSRDCN